MSTRSTPRAAAMGGVSLVELTIVLALALVVTSVAWPSLARHRSDARALGAARYLAATLAQERLGAIRRGTTGGLLFAIDGSTYRLQRVVDGNGDGLRSIDVAAGVDLRVGPAMQLDELFAGMAFAIRRPLPALEPGGPSLAEGDDPVRIGSTPFLAFTAGGSANSGTLYVSDDDRRQLAVRIYGTTGRVRVFEFSPASGAWFPR